jgi:hypothetical protein
MGNNCLGKQDQNRIPPAYFTSTQHWTCLYHRLLYLLKGNHCLLFFILALHFLVTKVSDKLMNQCHALGKNKTLAKQHLTAGVTEKQMSALSS